MKMRLFSCFLSFFLSIGLAMAGGEPEPDKRVVKDFVDGFKEKPAICYPNAQSTKKPGLNWVKQKGSLDVWQATVSCEPFTAEMVSRPDGFTKEYLAVSGDVAWEVKWHEALRNGHARKIDMQFIGSSFSLGSPPSTTMRCQIQLDTSIQPINVAPDGVGCVVMCCAFDKLQVGGE
ncbi:MAG: hypothetical protein ACSHXK_16660 [Oceanococcus sp.]